MHTYGSAALKLNTDLAFYCSNQSVEMSTKVSDIFRLASKPARATRGIRLLKRWQYFYDVFECRIDLNRCSLEHQCIGRKESQEREAQTQSLINIGEEQRFVSAFTSKNRSQ